MKVKRPLYLTLISVLLLSMATMIVYASPAWSTFPAPNRVYLDPVQKKYHTPWADASQLLGTKFSILVKVENISASGKMRGLEFKLWFNTTLLDVESLTTVASFSYWTDKTNETITPGKVWAGGVLATPYPTGDVTAFNVTFSIAYVPPYCTYDPLNVSQPQNLTVSCPLNLNETEVTDYLGAIYEMIHWGGSVNSYDEEDSYYEYMRDCKAVGAPTAVIWQLPDSVYVCDTVTLDGSHSLDGGAPPLTYLWTIAGPATLAANNVSVTTMHCDGKGTVNVTLTVTNAMGRSDTTKDSVEQREKLGCIIDVYTSHQRFCGQWTPNIGKMPGDPNADAFAPGDNFTLYAEVTYNGAPVNHVLVAFEVWDNLNRCVTYRVNETNKDGIASTYLRIPVPCDEQLFGKWTVIATCKVQSVKQEDRLKFDVGWILQIIDAWTTFEGKRETNFYRPCEDIDFHLVIKNIAWIPKNVTIVIVVYDECSVPLGQVIVRKTIAPGAYCHPNEEMIDLIETIHVPQWAYVGAGKVYYNLFTRLPSECGVAYSPEFDSDIFILLGPRP